jgi:RHS repeat-associated protein
LGCLRLTYESEFAPTEKPVLKVLTSKKSVKKVHSTQAFGTTSYQAYIAGKSAKRYRFTGMERDDETGLNYHNARYYIPWLGRWLNPDPIGIGDGVNVYAYCKNNPVKHIDKEGTQTTTEDSTKKEPLKDESLLLAAPTGNANPARPQEQKKEIAVLDEYSGKDAKKARGPVDYDTGSGGYNVEIPGDATTFPDKDGATKYIGWKDKAGKAHEYFWDNKLNAFANFERTEIYGGKGVAIATGYASSAKLGGVIPVGRMFWNTGGSENHPSFKTGQNIYNTQELAASINPIKTGAVLFGRGTNLIGAVSKQSLGLARSGGANASINYYSKLAMDMGYSSALTGARVKAGIFVQINHNVHRLAQGLAPKVLFSASPASIVGRSLQNQAIGIGFSQISFGIGVNAIR